MRPLPGHIALGEPAALPQDSCFLHALDAAIDDEYSVDTKISSNMPLVVDDLLQVC